MMRESSKTATGSNPAGKSRRSGASVRKVKRPAGSLRGVVADGVREAIMAGDYLPGSPLGEAELAKRFGVSRGPVREAMIQLEREYLVRSFPNRGSFVTALTEPEFDERIRLRSVLEPLALESARHRMTPAKLAEIERHLQQLKDVAATGNQSAYVICDYEFHVAIWEMSGRPLLKDLLVQISAPVFVFESIVSDRYHRASYDVVSDAQAHQGILDYLKGSTDTDACGCLLPVLELAMHAEKPVVFGAENSSRSNGVPK
ncbi:MAG: GntR family transcriptional regulator [Bryobacterales bacterium]|nr:GntR family transcriptional regulator [Bryobacterales bacterium]